MAFQRRIVFNDPCVRKYEILKDSPRQLWRKGDIVKFNNGFFHSCKDSYWASWFMVKKDLINFLKTNPILRDDKTPFYVINEYAVISQRYRIVKVKHYGTYRDYGTEITMLTGERIGKKRKFFMQSPFKKISSFPHTEIPIELNNFKDILLEHNEDTELCRNELIFNLTKIKGDVNGESCS